MWFYFLLTLDEMAECLLDFFLNAGTALLPKVVNQTKWVSPLYYVRKIHLASLASCPSYRGTVCVFHDSTVILLWKLSAWGGTPTSGKTLLSELISREQPSLSISLVCLRRGPGAPTHSHTGTQCRNSKESRWEEGEGWRSKPQNSKQGLKYPPLLCAKSLCTRKGSAMARHSKHRQAPWKHGHLAEKHEMRYGTNEADKSLNNYIFPLMCYHVDEECMCVKEREKIACSNTNMSHVKDTWETT